MANYKVTRHITNQYTTLSSALAALHNYIETIDSTSQAIIQLGVDQTRGEGTYQAWVIHNGIDSSASPSESASVSLSISPSVSPSVSPSESPSVSPSSSSSESPSVSPSVSPSSSESPSPSPSP